MSDMVIIGWFESQKGLGGTVDACATAIGMRHHSVSATCSRLVRNGVLCKTNKRMLTSSQHTAQVLVSSKYGSSKVTKKGKNSNPEGLSHAARSKVLKSVSVYLREKGSCDRKQYLKLVQKLLHQLDKIC